MIICCSTLDQIYTQTYYVVPIYIRLPLVLSKATTRYLSGSAFCWDEVYLNRQWDGYPSGLGIIVGNLRTPYGNPGHVGMGMGIGLGD